MELQTWPSLPLVSKLFDLLSVTSRWNVFDVSSWQSPSEWTKDFFTLWFKTISLRAKDQVQPGLQSLRRTHLNGLYPSKDPALDSGHSYWQLPTNFQREEVASSACLLSLGATLVQWQLVSQRKTSMSVLNWSHSLQSGFTSQQKIGQHKFQRYYPPAKSLTSMSALLCVQKCFAVLQTSGNNFSLHSHQCGDAMLLDWETFPSRRTSLEISFASNFS